MAADTRTTAPGPAVSNVNGLHQVSCRAEGREEACASYEEAVDAANGCCSINFGTKYGWQLLRRGTAHGIKHADRFGTPEPAAGSASQIPARIQRQRTAGWRTPANTVYVGRGSRWGNPYKLGEAKVRIPAIDGRPWEAETRVHKAVGDGVPYVHPDGSVTHHTVRLMTRDEAVEAFAAALKRYGSIWNRPGTTPADIRAALAGQNLSCWCAEGERCHADVLLAIANTPADD